jgi:hypothetical protein
MKSATRKTRQKRDPRLDDTRVSHLRSRETALCEGSGPK